MASERILGILFFCSQFLVLLLGAFYVSFFLFASSVVVVFVVHTIFVWVGAFIVLLVRFLMKKMIISGDRYFWKGFQPTSNF